MSLFIVSGEGLHKRSNEFTEWKISVLWKCCNMWCLWFYCKCYEIKYRFSIAETTELLVYILFLKWNSIIEFIILLSKCPRRAKLINVIKKTTFKTSSVFYIAKLVQNSRARSPEKFQNIQNKISQNNLINPKWYKRFLVVIYLSWKFDV